MAASVGDELHLAQTNEGFQEIIIKSTDVC